MAVTAAAAVAMRPRLQRVARLPMVATVARAASQVAEAEAEAQRP
jgi:hypothetical protein